MRYRKIMTPLNEKTDSVSPFSSFGWLLKIYRIFGVFPANFQNDFLIFRADWKISLWGLFLLTSLVVFSISTVILCGPQVEEFTSQMETFDLWAFASMAKISYAIKFLQLFYFYRAISSLEKAAKLSMDSPANLPNAKSVLHHHFRILLFYLVVYILNYAREAIFEHDILKDQTHLHYILTGIIIHFTWCAADFHFQLMFELPAILLLRLIQVNTHTLKRKSLELKARTTKSVDDCLTSLDRIYQSHQALASIFGPVLVTTIAFHTICIIIGMYSASVFLVMHANNLGGNGSDALSVMSMLVFSGAALSRLLFLTSYVHHFVEQVESSVEDMRELQTIPEHAVRVAKTMARYEKMAANGLSANGFFKVERGLLCAILGNILTYVIILVEFKINTL